MSRAGRSAAGASVAVIIPALHEPTLGSALRRAAFHAPDEIIAVHAGDEPTVAALRDTPIPPGARVLQAPRGRASQMNHGAAVATSDILVFLHADTSLAEHALDDVRRAIGRGALWGFFAVRIDDAHRLLRLVECLMNLRSRASAIATGDQAIFVRRDVFALLGGYARIELMEDIELCARLKWLGSPARLTTTVTTSGRRWRAHGVVRTILRMWWLRGLYALGVPPARLARWYR